MSKRFIIEWLAVGVAVGAGVPGLILLSMGLRMALVGDKPAASTTELQHIEQMQWAVQLSIYAVGVAALTFAILLLIKRT